MHSIFALLKRFHADERGVFAIIFGLMAIVLVALAGAAVDYTAMETARTRAQIALDSAALGLAPTIYDDDTNDEQLLADAQAIVSERLTGSNIEVEITDVDADTETGTLRFDGRITVGMAFVQLIGIDTLTAGITAEATKGSTHIEVAVALDVTYSMRNSKIEALETATGQLIDQIVQDTQDPTTSRMALVPYSMGVNLGDYADDVRGEPLPAKTMSGAYWVATSGTTSGSITGITRANPGVVTDNAHGLVTGDRIGISGVSGMTQINNKAYRVVKINNNSFSLQDLSTGNTIRTNSGYSNYSSGGTWRKCALTTCEVTVNATAHGFANDDWVVTTDVNNLTGLNNKAWQVKSRADNSFVLSGSIGIEHGTSAATRGNLWCTLNTAGSRPCEYLRYQAVNDSYRTAQITDCVNERATDTYTNDPPEAGDPVVYNWFGRHYPNGNSLNSCLGDEMVLMTDQKDDLHALADDMTAAGSTSGHIGLAWAWYLLSPSFNYLWPEDNRTRDPDEEDAEPVLKVLVLMTDGLFNTAYCNGVVSEDSNSVAGSSSQRINCDAPDDSTAQALELCDSIKDEDIVIYTVAFALDEISDDDERETAENLMSTCATDSGTAYNADDEQDLIDAFADIGRNITDLRLSM